MAYTKHHLAVDLVNAGLDEDAAERVAATIMVAAHFPTERAYLENMRDSLGERRDEALEQADRHRKNAAHYETKADAIARAIDKVSEALVPDEIPF